MYVCIVFINSTAIIPQIPLEEILDPPLITVNGSTTAYVGSIKYAFHAMNIHFALKII